MPLQAAASLRRAAGPSAAPSSTLLHSSICRRASKPTRAASSSVSCRGREAEPGIQRVDRDGSARRSCPSGSRHSGFRVPLRGPGMTCPAGQSVSRSFRFAPDASGPCLRTCLSPETGAPFRETCFSRTGTDGEDEGLETGTPTFVIPGPRGEPGIRRRAACEARPARARYGEGRRPGFRLPLRGPGMTPAYRNRIRRSAPADALVAVMPRRIVLADTPIARNRLRSRTAA